jgi:hypothetical protein
MPASVYPLIDPWSVFQSAMGVLDHERPLASQPVVGCKGCITAVYPVGHEQNPSGQTLVDVQPSNGLPLLYRVPSAHGHAHEETEKQAPRSNRRNATEPKERNRMEGSSTDMRPGTFVWVTFLGGKVTQPVITATLGFNQQDERVKEERTYSPSVDRIEPDGTIKPGSTRPLDSGMKDYPRSVKSYNGVREEIDNRGSRYIQTSTDRKPVWKESNQIEETPEPEGNYGVSTRGAVVGNIRFTTGRAVKSNGDGAEPTLLSEDDDEKHTGRMERIAMQADDGTIRDETASKVGAIVHKSSGRAWTKAASVYMEGDRAYVKLTGDADIYGDTGTMNNGTVKLGGPGMSDEIVLWPQLCQVISALCQIFDEHTHGYFPGPGGLTQTDATKTPQSGEFNGSKESFKAGDVFAGQSASPSAKHAGDPDDKRKDRAR